MDFDIGDQEGRFSCVNLTDKPNESWGVRHNHLDWSCVAESLYTYTSVGRERGSSWRLGWELGLVGVVRINLLERFSDIDCHLKTSGFTVSNKP